MKDSLKLIIEYLLKAFILIGVIYIILTSEIDQTKFSSIISNILTVSSIITGIVFAYLITKLFAIKSERENRQRIIDSLSSKLTDFRRLCYQILHHNYFWQDHDDISRFKTKYPLDTFKDLHDQSREDDGYSDFWSKDQGFSTTRADLYLAIEQIVDIHDNKDMWVFDNTASFRYSTDQISEYFDAANQIWYYLDYKWHKHSQGLFDENSLANSYETAKLSELINSIDSKYLDNELDRRLIARVSADFHGRYLPELYDLTERNQTDLPPTVKGILWTQVIMLVFGVLGPLILSSLKLSPIFQIYTLKYSLVTVTIGLLIYLFQMFDFSRQEIEV